MPLQLFLLTIQQTASTPLLPTSLFLNLSWRKSLRTLKGNASLTQAFETSAPLGPTVKIFSPGKLLCIVPPQSATAVSEGFSIRAAYGKQKKLNLFNKPIHLLYPFRDVHSGEQQTL